MNWNAATDADRLSYLTECRKEKMSWVAIAKSLHVGMLKVMPYRLQMPDGNVRCEWRNGDGELRCTRCGLIVETPGLCPLCVAQAEGRVFLYRELERLHG